MTRPHRRLLVLVGCFAAALFNGCGANDKAGAKGEAEKAGPPNATFKAGRGLHFTPATIKALGLATAEAKERPLSVELSLPAHVYESGPPSLASAFVPAVEAAALAGRIPVGARLLSVERAIEPATHQVEFLLSLAGPEHKVGDTVTLALHSPASSVLAVPRSAVVDGASGAFVYVVNGGYYLRTMVKLGAADAAWVEIADGLYAGDIVVTAAAQKLWLTELRLTKGGDPDGP